MLSPDEIQLIKEFNRNVAYLKTRDRKGPGSSWVKVQHIIAATGWNKEQLRLARDNGTVKFKRDEKGLWYDVNSIPPILIKKAASAVTETA